jgi:hypothetical protein
MKQTKISIIQSCKMKQLFFLLLLLSIIKTSSAQNVGIGTPTPNPSAALEIKSTNKGLLIPTMTTSQRFAINNPANGLMVYDTDKNELHHYNGTNWRPILNGEYWSRGITSRDRIGNSTDSVGIGTLSPTERLDINGNIRSRDDVLADGRVVAAGTVTGSGLITQGGLTVSSSGLIGGNLTVNSNLSTNSDLIVNNAAATLQLKASGTDKAFFQLSGDNLRLGTYSGNNNGQIILRSGGVDRLTVFENGNINIGSSSANAAKLRVSGDISVQDNITVQDNVNVGGRVTRSNLSNNRDFLPICFGKINEDGSIISGSGNFTVTTTPGFTGIYEITSNAINANVVFVGTSAQFGSTVWMKYESGNKVKVHCNTILNGSSSYTPFSFVMYRGD